MPLEIRKYGHAEWEPISRRDARKIMLKQIANCSEMADILLDDLKVDRGGTLEVDCGTRGTLRKRPRKKRSRP